ncbi:MAG: hypothetical protein QOC85_2176 [Streptomyces sp.]|nr:hypothetical protein [Streptomyces sp.]
MSFLSSRRRKPRLAPELDDGDLGRLLKSLRATTRSGTIGTTDLCVAQLSRLLDQEQEQGDWDRRSHRLSVLAGYLSASHLPSAWVTREPRNTSALVLNAWTELVRGHASGAMADASGMTKQCLLAADLDPQDPTPWVVLLGIARVERYAQADVFAAWNEILARDRWHREAYLSMLAYLSPEEAGSRVQVLDFIDSVRTRMPANAPCAAVELTAQVMQYHAALDRGGVDALVARNHWTNAQATASLERAHHAWPQPEFLHHAAALADLNLLAYALMAADWRRQAAPVFEAIGSRVTSWPWQSGGDPLAAFEHARNKASV